MRSIEISWTEVSQHRVRVQVPDCFDASSEDYAWENRLGELDTDGFLGLERTDVTVRELPDGDYGNLEEFAPASRHGEFLAE
jgi:hypothetical protein